MQALLCLAKRCSYRNAKSLLIAEHRKAPNEQAPSSITSTTIINVAKKMAKTAGRDIRRNPSQDSETAHRPNAGLHETTTPDRPRATEQILCQARCTSQEQNNSSMSRCAQGKASATSEALITSLPYDLPLSPQASEPPSSTADDALATVNRGVALVSLGLDAADYHARPWNYEHQSRSNTGLQTPPTSSPDIDDVQCENIDKESSCIDLTASLPKEVAYSEQALLYAISNVRKSVTRLDLNVRQDFEVLPEFVMLVLQEGPIDSTKETLRSAIAMCQKGFQRHSPKARSDLDIICELVTDVMNQEDVSIHWDVDELDCSDDDEELEDGNNEGSDVTPTICDNNLRRKASDMDDSAISFHEDQSTRPTKKRRVSDATQENMSLANIDSGLDLLYQAVRKVELRQSLWEHGLG